MKFLRLFVAVVPLFTASLFALDQELVTPEQMFPQLDAILKHAVSQSPRMVTRATELETAQNDRVSARAGLLPTVGGFYNFNEASDDRSDQPERLRVEKQYYNFSAVQPLFHWGERRNTDRMGAIRLQMAQGNYREGYRLLAQEVRATYLHLIGDKVRAHRASLANEYYVAQLKRGEEQLSKRAISEAQIFPIRLDAERGQITDERTRFDFENNKIAFARLTGMPVLTDEEIPDTIPLIKPQNEVLEHLLAGYLAQKDKPSASAVAARRTLAIARLTLANDRKRLYPKLSLIAGASQDEQSYTVNVANKYAVQSIYGGFIVNWAIFDGFTTGAVVRSSRARIRQAEVDYRALDETLTTSAQNQVKLLDFTARAAVLNERLLGSSQGNLSLRREEFGRGVISQETVTLAEIGLVDSQINTLGSRAEYYVAVGEFLGMLTEDPVLANIPAQQ